jgi:hypothetical protein
MHIVKTYSHLNGEEWMKIRRPNLQKEIEFAISSINAEECRNKASKEKTMKGSILFSPKELNTKFKEELGCRGWENKRTDFYLTEDSDLMRQISSMPAIEQKQIIEDKGLEAHDTYNETDFVKEKVAVEVQFGKYFSGSYDCFVKHQFFYNQGEIDCGVEILVMKSMKKEMSTGPAYYEKILFDITRHGRGVPAVPLVLIGIAP